MTADPIARFEHRVELVAADDVSQHQHGRQQAHPAERGHEQSHRCAAPRLVSVVPIGDQHERREARQLPEEHELNEIAGEYDAEHRAHKREKEREEPRHGIGGRHVIARVEHDQRADYRHERRKDPRVAIHAQMQDESELRDPGDAPAYDSGVRDLWVERRHQDGACNAHRAREPRLDVASIRRQERCAYAAEEGKQ
jgi:hypothetical protein